MRVFISWSKEPSRTVAEALRDWLPDVIQNLQPWMSSTDIGAGARWSAEIADALAGCRIGILCVTPANQREPWLLFEAGALAKTLKETFVCPYLIGLKPAELAAGPLTQFQAATADEDGTFRLLSTINTALGAEALAEDRLRRLFARNWPDMEGKLRSLREPSPVAHRSEADVLSEVLETVRVLARRLPDVPAPVTPLNVADVLRNVFPDLDDAQLRLLMARIRKGLSFQEYTHLVQSIHLTDEGSFFVPASILSAVSSVRAIKRSGAANQNPGPFTDKELDNVILSYLEDEPDSASASAKSAEE